jgi:hypothetical protein
MMKELSRNEGLTNYSRLRIVFQKVDECQNCFELPKSAKKWKRHIMLLVHKTKLRRDNIELL